MGSRREAMSAQPHHIRNLGISAHIDSGKTTLTERILFYTNRIHAIHEVRGKDGVGATMDSMDLERERGITIQSAATSCSWREHDINIIDTPGHVDFTIEVERALRVLDGAILVLCGVAGVQSQSLTVDRQMRRYNVPRVAFINKLDRQAPNPFRARDQLRDKLRHNAVLMQLPICLEGDLVGVVDLVTMKALYFEGERGEEVREDVIPAELQEQADLHREEMLDAASMFSDDLTEAVLEETETVELIKRVVREATIARRLTTVYLGKAKRTEGGQAELDAVVDYLSAPHEILNVAVDLDEDEKERPLSNDPEAPFVGLAFKLEDGRYGQLTYLRAYQGTLKKGDFIHNVKGRQRVKVGRLVRMHADQMEEITSAKAGDIVALFGIDCRSGDTFTDGTVNYSMTSMYVPAPVISLTVMPKDKSSQSNLSKALQRFTKEDPTFRVHADAETGDTVISGMGELHLDVYLERMRREYRVAVETSPPRVAYRETITRRAEFNYLHKKQTGGSGQYARVAGFIEPNAEDDYTFVDLIRGGAIPREFIPSCNKGFRSMLSKGMLIEVPVVGVSVTINDGSSHTVDSSDMAFQEASKGAWRKTYPKAKPVILEPLMRVVVEGPAEYHGTIVGTLMQRRGMIVGTSEEEGFCRVESQIPLAEMFGYATALRSVTQAKAEFTMEFSRYEAAPASVSEELVEQFNAQKRSRR